MAMNWTSSRYDLGLVRNMQETHGSHRFAPAKSGPWGLTVDCFLLEAIGNCATNWTTSTPGSLREFSDLLDVAPATASKPLCLKKGWRKHLQGLALHILLYPIQFKHIQLSGLGVLNPWFPTQIFPEINPHRILNQSTSHASCGRISRMTQAMPRHLPELKRDCPQIWK